MLSLWKRLGRKREEQPFCTAVVPAAGSSARMEGKDKLLLQLGDYPVLARTLRVLEECPFIHEIIVVTRQDLIVPVSQLCQEYGIEKASQVLSGGETRTLSVLAGVRGASREAELIAIHDGARPFVTRELLEEVITEAARCGAAAPAIPVTDTIKRSHGGVVEETLDRDTLFAVQTPQVFEAGLIRAALQKAVEDGVNLTDDCAAVERLGMEVRLTRGDRANLKITTPADLDLGLGILNGRGELV